jgi:hypothetical protein
MKKKLPAAQQFQQEKAGAAKNFIVHRKGAYV